MFSMLLSDEESLSEISHFFSIRARLEESTEELCIEDSKLLHIAAFLYSLKESADKAETITTSNL